MEIFTNRASFGTQNQKGAKIFCGLSDLCPILLVDFDATLRWTLHDIDRMLLLNRSSSSGFPCLSRMKVLFSTYSRKVFHFRGFACGNNENETNRVGYYVGGMVPDFFHSIRKTLEKH